MSLLLDYATEERQSNVRKFQQRMETTGIIGLVVMFCAWFWVGVGELAWIAWQVWR